MPLHVIVVDAESAVMEIAPAAEPVVDLVLRDEVLVRHLHTVGCRECFLFNEQVVKLRPQFLLGNDGAEAQPFLAAFKLP